MKDVQKLSELVKNVAIFYDFANPTEKEHIIRTLFSELYVSNNMLEYKVQIGLECFENRFDAICDPTENRTLITRLRTLCPNR